MASLSILPQDMSSFSKPIDFPLSEDICL